MEYNIGLLAKSLAGHDKGKVFMIVGVLPEYVLLADGRSKNLNRPKTKNKKHIQIIHRDRESETHEDLSDAMIREAVDDFWKSIRIN